MLGYKDNDKLENIFNGDKGEKAINEFKILFKSGYLGYFKLVIDTDDNAEKFYQYIGDSIRDGVTGVFELIELSNDKKTFINIADIATIGYSKVYKNL